MQPPRLARFLVSTVVPDPNREFLLGDLDEQFAETMRRQGRVAAWRRYWRQSLGAVRHRRALQKRATLAAGGHRKGLEMGSLWRDIRFGTRTALRSPGYSVVVIVTLALAIGANTLLFSLANPLLLKPLPLGNRDRLGWVWEINGSAGVSRGGASAADLLDWRAGSRTFTALAATDSRDGTLTGHGRDAESVALARITPNLENLWDLHPAAGRLLEPGENAPGRPLVGVLAYHYWREAFHGDPGVIGRSFFLNGSPIAIVGVMEPGIEFGTLATYDLWVPLPLDPAAPRDDRTLQVVGLLAPGATVASADAELRALSRTQAREYPATNRDWEAHVVSTTEAIAGPDTWAILALLGVVVVFVLLIGCANLANLARARLMGRQRELAVRQALGASRLQLIRPVLSESLLLALAGGVVGLGLAQAGLRAINAATYDQYLQHVGIDADVLIFTAGLALLTPLLFSFWPAISAGREAVVDTLRGARSTTAGPAARRRANVLVAAQVALALSLLVVAGLILQTVDNIRHMNIGIDVRHLITARVDLPRDRYPDDRSRAAFADEIASRLGALPGVTGAAVASQIPVFDPDVVRNLTGTLHDGSDGSARPWACWSTVSTDFFRTAGIALVAGRSFRSSDSAGAQPVAVLNRLAAEKYFDAVGNALGRVVVLHDRNGADRQVTIVGVVADTHNSAIVRSSPQLYVPVDQSPVPVMRIVVSAPAPADRASDIRAAVRELDQTVGLSNPKPLLQEAREATSTGAIMDALFGGFAALALALAAAGLYGVISYSVGRRQREIGVRLALGAAPGSIRRMVLREGLGVTAWGAAAGLLLAFLIGHAAASLLYGVSPDDPATFAGVLGAIGVVSLVAVWAPAMRAMRVDPVTSLRTD
jgi:putative ABC transport system permease protein